MAALVVFGAGCSAGPATVDAEYDEEGGVVRITFGTEGKNVFSIGDRDCEAPKAGTCRVEVPVVELTGGWNTLRAGAKRRTGMDEVLSAEVHLGAAAFPRDCDVVEVRATRREDAAVDLQCSFPPGYRGELWGEPLVDGRRRIPASLLVDERGLDAADDVLPTPSDPLLVVDVPLEVVNESGGRLARPVRVAVPAPFVQFEIDGWEPLWFERSVPIRLRAEAGAAILVDGKRVRPEEEGRAFVLDRVVKPGENVIDVRAEMPGRIPSVHRLVIEGKYPESPLQIDQPLESEFETDQETLRVRGRTHPRAEVFWGRIPVPVKRDGSFWVDTYLEEGRNDVEISAFLAETSGGRLTRKPSTRTFVVDRRPPPPAKRTLEAAEPEVEPLSIGEVADHPWQTTGESVRFALRADNVDLFPSEGGCRASIEGVGCGREETRSAWIAFHEVAARACVGTKYRTFVEFDFCPKVEDGSWVEVDGTVLGGYAGRAPDGGTIVMLRVQGRKVTPRARVLSGSSP